ncbi:MAG: DUF1653 domain-containing protein [Roseburia sp.]|nr:DUF1653 domain-containing protein [Roseburia sp.]MCM1097031.1 DUF1653 domain-containing protein [Ruminococcus flavefaciens]
MSFIPKPQEIYKHFKGNLYQITAIAEHTETGEALVVYQALYGDFRTYARPLEMFVSRVDRNKYPDAEQEFRFELQGPEARRQREESGTAEAAPKPAEARDAKAAGETAVAQDAKSAGEKWLEVPQSEPEAELNLDPMLLEFLDANDYQQRLNILAGLYHRITDDMLTTMAIACDVEVNEGDIEERYEALKTCLLTLERYECNRIR